MWDRIVRRQLSGKLPPKVVNYTIRPGTCPVGTWYAIAKLGLDHHGHAEKTGRTEWCRAKIDLDGTVLAIWDWVDRTWVDARTAISIVRTQNEIKEMANGHVR